MPLLASLVTALDAALDRWAEERVGTAVAAQVLALDHRLDVLDGKLNEQHSTLQLVREGMDGLQTITSSLVSQVQQQEIAMTDITDAVMNLQQQVQAETDAQASAITLLNGIAEQIRQNATAPDALNALADQVQQNAQALADAVQANTDVAGGGTGPTPEPPPAP